MELIWDDLFITGKLSGNETNRELIAKGLSGWANCMMGQTPPNNFGVGMFKIAEILGGATPDFLHNLANDILLSKNTSDNITADENPSGILG